MGNRHLGTIFFVLSGIRCLSAYDGIIAAQNDTAAYRMIISEESQPIQSPGWRFGVQNGLTYMWANKDKEETELISNGANADDVDDFYKQICRAYHFSADIYKLFPAQWGLGLKYSVTASRAEQFIRFDTGDGLNMLNTNIVNREYVNFIGVSFLLQRSFKKAPTLQLDFSMSLGYARYRNELETDFENYYFRENLLSRGNTFGGDLEMRLEYFPVRRVSIVGGVGCFLARFNRLTVTDGRLERTIDLTGEDRKNVSRFDFFFGVGFYFK